MQGYENSVKTVQGAVVLHNFILSQSPSVDDLPGNACQLQDCDDNDLYLHDGTAMNAQHQRETLADFFLNDGRVPFQDKMALRSS